MKVYILLEEWINKNDYSTEKAFTNQFDCYETFEAAEDAWGHRSNLRAAREDHAVRPAAKEDLNADGISIRYYVMDILYKDGEWDEVLIKTTIAERTVL